MKINISIKNFIFLFCISLCGSSAAQLHYNFEAITEKNGLSDNRVTAILKDSRGFMWFGTRNGLNQYDGSSFKIFRPGKSNSISSEVINDIAEDSSGKLWIATMEGLNCYDPEKNTWQNILPTSSSSPKGLPNYIVWSLYFDKNNLLWIASDVYELVSYNISTKKFTFYDWPAFTRQAFPKLEKKYRSIEKIVPRSDNELWLGSNLGLLLFNIQKGEFNFIGSGFEADVTALLYDAPNKKVYIASQDSMLFCYDESNKKYQQVKLIPTPYPSSSFSRKNVHDMPTWIATMSGLAEISADGKASLVQNIPQLSSSLLPGSITKVYRDNNSIEWIATGNGVNKYDVNTSAFFLPLLPTADKSADNNMGPVVYDETEKKYYVCSQQTAELFVIDAESSAIQRISSIGGSRLDGSMALRIDQGKNIWFLTENHAYLYNRSLKKFELFITPNGNKRVSFRDVVRDADGNYWFAAFNGGLYYYDIKKKDFTALPMKDTFYSYVISSLLSDTLHRTVWIGTFDYGVYCYNLDTKRFTWFLETEKHPEYVQLNLVNEIYHDKKTKVWIGTYTGGVWLYEYGRPPEKVFTHLTMKTGLSNNSYFSITGDGNNTIWMLEGKGLTAFDINGNFLKNIGREKLMPFTNYVSDPRYPHYMFYNKHAKELLIAAGGGLVFYYPDLKIPTGHFPVVITGISVNNRLISDSAFDMNKPVTIPYRNNSLSIDFAGLLYSGKPGIQYEYRLQGYDNEWTPAGTQHNLKFSNLSPGSYTLYIRAKDAEGNLNPSVASFSFRIIPPFWRTWWFIAIVILTVSFILYKWINSLKEKIESEKMLNYFATSLYGKNTVEDVFWDVAKNCMSKLQFEDCVIYQYDNTKRTLLQKAAYGAKNTARHEINNPIEIPAGKGIVGSVAQTARAEIIRDTSRDNRYIVDDESRLSEITVPVIVEGKVFGIIDSEHPKKNFFRKRHLKLLMQIAEICSTKISKYLVEEKLRSKIARDLHDELGSNLTSINIISKVALQQNENETVNKQLRKIKDHSGKMMESMSDIVWAINPDNDTAEKMMIRMKEHTAEMLEPVKINYHFYEEGPLNEIRLGLNERKDIFLIFKEALNNSVKYSGATEVIIWLKKDRQHFEMVLMDNGKGFDCNTVSRGNGLNNIESRAAAMNAQVKINGIPGSGTSIILQLPLT